MNVMRTRILAMSLVSTLSACANYETVQVPPAPEVIQRQVEVLSAWKPGMDAAATDAVIHWYKYWDYGSLETDGAWRIVEITNPETNGSFGLFFHDAKLVSLTSDDDARHVIDCLQTYNLHGKHWLTQGMGGYARWLESRSVLGSRQALASHGNVSVYVHDTPTDRARRARGAPTTSDVGYGVGYGIVLLPLVIAYLPYYFIHGKAAEEKEAKAKAALETFQDSLELGRAAPAPELFPADDTYTIGATEVRQYHYGSFAYGVRDGTIVMLERPAAFEEDERLDRIGQSSDEWRGKHSHADCAALRHWQ